MNKAPLSARQLKIAAALYAALVIGIGMIVSAPAVLLTVATAFDIVVW